MSTWPDVNLKMPQKVVTFFLLTISGKNFDILLILVLNLLGTEWSIGQPSMSQISKSQVVTAQVYIHQHVAQAHLEIVMMGIQRRSRL